MTIADTYPPFGEQAASPSPDAIVNDCPTATSGGEPVESCAALADRLSALRWRLGAIHDSLRAESGAIADALDGLDAKATTTNARLGETVDLLTELRDGQTTGGLATVELSGEDRVNLADATTAVRSAVWFVAGLLAALLAATQLREVFRA